MYSMRYCHAVVRAWPAATVLITFEQFQVERRSTALRHLLRLAVALAQLT